MRVLIVLAPGHGHLKAVAPLALALQGAGHEVRLGSSPSFCRLVAEAGLETIPAGIDWLESEVERFFPELAGLDPDQRSFALGRLFEYHVPRSMVPDLRAGLDSWRPDVVVTEPGGAAGQHLAELERIPHALIYSGIPFPRYRATLPPDPADREALMEAQTGPRSRRGLRAELGLPEDGDQAVRLVLDQIPPSVHLMSVRHITEVAHPLRPLPFNLGRGRDADWEWLERLPPGRATVCLSLGTVFHRAGPVVRSVLGALAGLPVNALVAVGDLAPSELGPLPEHVRVLDWLPFDRALPACDLLITHGSWGSISEALFHGLPVLALPQTEEHFVSALRLRSVGAGLFLARSEVAPEAVRERVETLLEDPIYAQNAARIQREIEAMPPPEAAVPLLERLARDGQPIVGPELPWSRARLSQVPEIGIRGEAAAEA